MISGLFISELTSLVSKFDFFVFPFIYEHGVPPYFISLGAVITTFLYFLIKKIYKKFRLNYFAVLAFSSIFILLYFYIGRNIHFSPFMLLSQYGLK